MRLLKNIKEDLHCQRGPRLDYQLGNESSCPALLKPQGAWGLQLLPMAFSLR